MSKVEIRAENLGKLYHIGERERYKALRDVLADALCAPRRWLRGHSEANNRHSEPDFIWALRNISLEIKQGEIVGIVGRNGAGKTTLLRILSRITKPTEGGAEIFGRVGSLLEVGTGFHPELTGRENVYLSGAILGMKKAEIARKFDEIIAFAEVEKFIDTPVKHYSAGMQIRLGFAVAAHLEPEILMVDEVLAVGDARFQKRCLGRMEDVAKSGRTVLFVSHDMQSVSILCRRAVLLEQGKLAAEGPAQQIVSSYLSAGCGQMAQAEWPFEQAPGNEVVKLRAVRALARDREAASEVPIGEHITLEVEFWALRRAHVMASFHVLNERGILLFSTANLEDWSRSEYDPGAYRYRCVIPSHLLTEGTYYVTLYLSRGPHARIDVHKPELVSFRVIDDGSGRGDYTGQWAGLIRPRLTWAGERVGDLPTIIPAELRPAPVGE